MKLMKNNTEKKHNKMIMLFHKQIIRFSVFATVNEHK